MATSLSSFSLAHTQKCSVCIQYCAVDTSPVSNYIINPFWNNVVKVRLVTPVLAWHLTCNVVHTPNSDFMLHCSM